MIRFLRTIADLKAAREECDRLRARVGELERRFDAEVDSNRLREDRLVEQIVIAARGLNAPAPFIPTRRPVEQKPTEAEASGERMISDEELYAPPGYTEDEIRYAAEQYHEEATRRGMEVEFDIILEKVRRSPEQYV